MKAQEQTDTPAEADAAADDDAHGADRNGRDRRGGGLGGFAKLVLILFVVLAVGIALFAILTNGAGGMPDFDYPGFD